MKSKVYIFLIIFMIIATFVVSSQNLVNAAPRKQATSSSKSKSSAKRAATNKASTKRAATSSASTKRAATSKSNTKRLASTKTSTKRVMARGSTTRTSTTTSAPKTTVCPVSTFIRKTYDEEKAEYIFYSSKTQECTLPEDNIAEVVTWEKDKKDTYDKSLQTRPSWISEAETAFLTCIPGYVEKTVDKVKTCIIASGICPVNDIVEKSGTTYINPNTQEECVAPEKAVVRNVKGEENLLSYTLADEKAYMFECPANYYPVTDVETSLKVKCDACPTGTSSTKGASSIADCVGKDDVVEPEPVVEEEAPAPVVNTVQVNEDEAQRLAKLRIKKVEGTEDDYTCVDGWTNNWGTVSLPSYSRINGKSCNVLYPYVVLRKVFIMDKDGKIKNVIDRNAYGKNKRGCPIKIDKYYVYEEKNRGALDYTIIAKDFEKQPSSDKYCQFESIPGAEDAVNLFIRPGNSAATISCGSRSVSYINNDKFGLLRMKMVSSDIDNTGVKGWTEEEYEAWDGYKPVLAYYFQYSFGITSDSACKTSAANHHDINAVKTLSSDNLFKYWD